MQHLVVYAADVGSIQRGNFAWARASDTPRRWLGGPDICDLVSSVSQDLLLRKPVVLGFECPLFVPVPRDSTDILKAREGEPAGSAWSASGGIGSLGAGLVEVPWVLRALRAANRGMEFFLDWNEFLASDAKQRLFLWEAFVTRGAHCRSENKRAHLHDAKTAVRTFRRRHTSGLVSDTFESRPLLSLVGAALLWSGARTGSRILSEQQPVVLISQRQDRACRCP